MILIPKGGKEIYRIPEKELANLYWKEDRNISQIANRYGCSKSTISQRLRKYKIKIKPIKINPKKIYS